MAGEAEEEPAEGDEPADVRLLLAMRGCAVAPHVPLCTLAANRRNGIIDGASGLGDQYRHCQGP